MPSHHESTSNRRWLFVVAATGLAVMGWAGPASGQTGHVLNGVGPVNQAMGGAGTALPLDAIGATFHNPASIAGLEGSEIGFSFELLGPQTDLSSSVSAGAFGPGVPAVDQAGRTGSDTGITPIPSFAFVCRPEDSCWSYGISGFGIAGFGVDYAGSAANPITSPQPPAGLGFGPIYSNFQFMQLTMTFACQVSETLAVGLGLNGDWATLGVSPFSAASPDDADGDSYATYPPGAQSASVWGLGFQLGIFYDNPRTGWHAGAALKSPQWMQTFKINSYDELGRPRQLRFDLDYPMIFSLGVAYSGWHRSRVAVDLRYIDYRNTDGFQPAGFDPTGAMTGFGWRSIWVVAVGWEYRLHPCFTLRFGYAYNQNPVRDQDTFFNVHAPGIVQHHVSTGFSWHTRHHWDLSLAFRVGLPNTIRGPWQSPAGAVPGTSVESRLATYSLILGLSKRL